MAESNFLIVIFHFSLVNEILLCDIEGTVKECVDWKGLQITWTKSKRKRRRGRKERKKKKNVLTSDHKGGIEKGGNRMI
jgi:hypothetical protein